MKEFKSFITNISQNRKIQVESKAVFISGGPGSGKDVIIREVLSQNHINELNHLQVYNLLADKDNFSKNVKDHRMEAIAYRLPLIINAPAGDIDKILYIKEELEEFGYSVMMVYVNTTDEVSKERNERLSRSMNESVRHERWLTSQENKYVYSEVFENYIQFDNMGSMKQIIQDIKETKNKIGKFLGKINPQLKADGPNDITPDNRASQPVDDVRIDAPKRTKTYTFKTYSEGSQPTIKYSPEPKIPNFQKDNDSNKKKKRGSIGFFSFLELSA